MRKTTKRCMKIKFGQLGNTVNGMYGRGKQQGCIGVGVSLIPTFKSHLKKKKKGGIGAIQWRLLPLCLKYASIIYIAIKDNAF